MTRNSNTEYFVNKLLNQLFQNMYFPHYSELTEINFRSFVKNRVLGKMGKRKLMKEHGKFYNNQFLN